MEQWQYFTPVQAGMPKNCSADVSLAIEYIDGILMGDDAAAITALKTKFALGDLEHNDDFAGVLQNGPWQWQDHDFAYGAEGINGFCDSVENVGPLFPDATTIPGAEGVGMEKAVEGYARWITDVVVNGSKFSFRGGEVSFLV